MYNVLVVDDSSITRKSIILTVDWSSLDCKIIAEAANGMKALELTKTYMPDLIITDIKMPEMDGLTFTQKAKALIPWVKVIVITGYNEFKYAQDAIKVGAFDLVLKPINNQELCNIVNKAVNILNDEKKEQWEKNSLKDTISKNMEEMKAKSVIDMIEGLNVPDIYKANHGQKRFFIFTIGFKIKSKLMNDENFHSFIQDTKESAEALKVHFNCEMICFWLNNNFTVMVAENDKNAFKKVNDDVMGICNYFVEKNAAVESLDYIIGVSEIHNSMEKIKHAYAQSLDALDCKFYFFDKKIIYADMIKSRGLFNEYSLMKKVYDSIKDKNIDQFIKSIDEIYDVLLAETPNTTSVKNLLSNICFVALDFLYQVNGCQFCDYKSHAEVNTDINAADNIFDAVSYVKNFVGMIIASFGKEGQKNYSKVTLQVIDYLNRSYSKKVSLQEISDLVGLTPSHLSRVIKKDTGESFVDLFNKIKVSMAEKLLKESNLKVYEVANKVGIDNYSYFYQLFKKVTGTSPKDYYNK